MVVMARLSAMARLSLRQLVLAMVVMGRLSLVLAMAVVMVVRFRLHCL
jgi:hypothetical protein